MTGPAWLSQFSHLTRSLSDLSQGDNPAPQRVVITLHDGTRIVGNLAGEDVDELTRFVDAWQSGRRGGVDINGRDVDGSPTTVKVEYRDVLRVDFPEVAS